jgi:hypothetical protein
MQVQRVTFLDSLAFMHMPLADFPKTFDIIETKKGFFPHFFNKEANIGYIGPIPAVEFFDPDGMSLDRRAEFHSWYKDQTGKTYDFNKEFLEYCRSDVDILRRGCGKFQELFKSVSKLSPFETSTTIAGAYNTVFRTYFLKEELIGIVPTNGYREDKQSIKALKWLDWESHRNNFTIRHSKNSPREFRIGSYRVDGIYNKQVFEFNGCVFHGCPRCFRDRETINPLSGHTMGHLYDNTVKREAFIRGEGYQLVVKWECDFDREVKENPELESFLKTLEYSDPINPRDALYGGRTEATRLFYEPDNGETIEYVDFTSLYPYCCKYKTYPIKHPIVLKCDDIAKDPLEYEGLIKCKVLPPRSLYHPVLPYRSGGKLKFALCRACCESNSNDSCKHND